MQDPEQAPLLENEPRWEGGAEDKGQEAAWGRRPRRAARGWWVGRWLRTLGQLFDASRLATGRALAQEGRVLNMQVQHGLVAARVQGESPEALPHRVHLAFATFTDAQWERIIHLLGERAIYAAQLMNDELPEESEGVFRAAGVSLFPSTVQDLGAECSCSDWANTCKHRAAVCCLLGEWLDRDPFLLFTLRGRTRDEVTSALRAHRASQAAGAAPESHERGAGGAGADPRSLPADPERFWGLDAALEGLQIHIAPPEVERELLQILGELSPLQDDETRRKLEAIYREVSRRALDASRDGEAPAPDGQQR